MIVRQVECAIILQKEISFLDRRGCFAVGDKRKFKRIEFREPVQYRIVDGQAMEGLPPLFYTGTVSCDLSEGGIKFRCDDYIPSQVTVEVMITLPEEALLEIEGQVAWIQKLPHADGYLLGIEFTKSAENKVAFKKLHQYMDNLFSLKKNKKV